MALNLYLGRPIIDRARLTALYNVSVHWKPETTSRGERLNVVTNEPQGDDNDPDMYTAMREQLGLKLASERGRIEVLIVESAEPPTSN
jgi:uncharacterized protein (TIGR03435 family)